MADAEPQVPQAFKDYVAARGWTCRVEWNSPWADPETGESYEGYWAVLIYREEMLPSGDIHFRALEASTHLHEGSTRGWELLCDAADAEWERAKEEFAHA